MLLVVASSEDWTYRGKRNVWELLWENIKGEGHLENLGVNGWALLKPILKKTERNGVDWICLAQNRDKYR